ncbi:zinc-binding dehydrogenase [Kurthia sibirica]|uniref:zinc-binding dehydrogenase n=1 Tax=Kurthia sibirica TaxID=202750 RepID=UPI0024825228|nr:zinc-binding dehydrogenase [Kurthia sibirica]
MCGSDLHAYHHGAGIPIEAAHAFTGDQAPLVLGHEFAGTVVEIGEDVTNVMVGDRVTIEPILYCGKCIHCRKGSYNLCTVSQGAFLGLAKDGGFAEFAVTEASRMHKIPDNMSLEEAALVEPTAVAFHAVRKSGLKVGQTVAVFGAGPIGLLTLLAAQAAGATTTFVVDLSKERLEKARELGATYTINPLEENAVEKIMRITGSGVDIAFEAAGAQPTFTSAMNAIDAGGTVTVVAVIPIDVTMNAIMPLIKETTLNFSCAYANEFPQVIDLIASGRLDVKKVITKKITLAHLVEQGLELLLVDKSQAKIIVSPK